MTIPTGAIEMMATLAVTEARELRGKMDEDAWRNYLRELGARLEQVLNALCQGAGETGLRFELVPSQPGAERVLVMLEEQVKALDGIAQGIAAHAARVAAHALGRPDV